jgi:hypothetical protein
LVATRDFEASPFSQAKLAPTILAQILHPENAEPDHLRTCKLPVGTTEGIPLLVSFHPETRPCHSERSEESLRIQ